MVGINMQMMYKQKPKQMILQLKISIFFKERKMMAKQITSHTGTHKDWAGTDTALSNANPSAALNLLGQTGPGLAQSLPGLKMAPACPGLLG